MLIEISTQIIHRKFENMQVFLIAKVFLKFEGMLGQYVENLMNTLKAKVLSKILNFL